MVWYTGNFSVVAGPSETVVGTTHQTTRRHKPERQ